jgi:hypothetical protein
MIATPALSSLAAFESWWTGKDSNLRSPQGAADLQSAGFSHSPTRPGKTSPDTRCVSRKSSETQMISASLYSPRMLKEERAKTQNGLVSKDTSPFMIAFRDSLCSLPCFRRWSWRRGLNPRPSDYKSDALPAELRQRRSNRVRIADTTQEMQDLSQKAEQVASQFCGKGIGRPLSLNCRQPHYFLHLTAARGSILSTESTVA